MTVILLVRHGHVEGIAALTAKPEELTFGP